MKKLLTLLVVCLVVMSPLAAQQEVNIYAHYTEPEIRKFLEGQDYRITRFNSDMPDSLEGAVLYTSFYSMAGQVESYSSSETVIFKNAGIEMLGGLHQLSSSKVIYTLHGFKDGNTPVVLFLGSASWIYELSYSNVETTQLEYFRIYTPSILDNTLKELAWFLANELKLVIHKPEIEFVKIYSGEFTMGASKKEKKKYLMPYSMFGNQEQHVESVGSFEMSKYEVTFDQYDAFCKATGRKLAPDGGFGRGNRPVIFVSYFDAVDFAEWMGCRLPTETEWEYACRAGTTTMFNTGESLCCDQANVGHDYNNDDCSGKYCSKRSTEPVGSYAPNAWGLYDMHGNVSEWTSSWFDNYITQTPLENGSKTIRGGSFQYYNTNASSAARFGLTIRLERENYVPNSLVDLGIRLVRQVER